VCAGDGDAYAYSDCHVNGHRYSDANDHAHAERDAETSGLFLPAHHPKGRPVAEVWETSPYDTAHAAWKLRVLRANMAEGACGALRHDYY